MSREVWSAWTNVRPEILVGEEGVPDSLVAIACRQFAGIGYTVSLFIADIGFSGSRLVRSKDESSRRGRHRGTTGDIMLLRGSDWRAREARGRRGDDTS